MICGIRLEILPLWVESLSGSARKYVKVYYTCVPFREDRCFPSNITYIIIDKLKKFIPVVLYSIIL